MKCLRIVPAICAFIAFASITQATPIRFVATGNVDITGFVEIDDATFNGSIIQSVSNAEITDLSLTVFGSVFGFGDVVTTDSTFIDSSGVNPVIIDGGGLLADNGSQAIAFFSDGFNLLPLDGDASLAYSPTPGFTIGDFTFHAVQWVPTLTDVPEPATYTLTGLGLATLAWVRRKRIA